MTISEIIKSYKKYGLICSDSLSNTDRAAIITNLALSEMESDDYTVILGTTGDLRGEKWSINAWKGTNHVGEVLEYGDYHTCVLKVYQWYKEQNNG